MPIYEHICSKCGRIVEAIRKVDDPPPKCHGRKMKKLMSKSSFIFKCGGFYATDYKDKKPEKSLAPPKKESKDA